MPLFPGLKSKKKSKTDTQAKQLSAYEPENESQQAPQAEEAPQQQQEEQDPQTEEAPQQQQQQLDPQTEEAPQQQQAAQTEEAPQQQQQQAPPQTVTQAPSEPQPERINYEHYNQFISPYRMEDDLEMGAIEFQRQVTKWMRTPPYS